MYMMGLMHDDSSVFLVLLGLAITETASAFVRTKSYYSAPVVSASPVAAAGHGSSIKADEVGKAKQTFEMVGSALLLLPYGLHWIGLGLLLGALPLAIYSLTRKFNRRVVYIRAAFDVLTPEFLLYVHGAKAQGNTLVAGVLLSEETKSDVPLAKRVELARLCPQVDLVVEGVYKDTAAKMPTIGPYKQHEVLLADDFKN